EAGVAASRPHLDRREHEGRIACGGIEDLFLVGDGREIADGGMTPARMIETLDEREYGDARFSLRLEPAPVEQLAFERGEEALRHRVVVGVADRSHRGPHAGLAATRAEGDRCVLGGFKWSLQHGLCWQIEASGQ